MNLFKVFVIGSCFVALIFVLSSSCTRIDAGHVGIRVNLYGSERGVDDVTEVTGIVWYNPLTTRIYEVPTYVQNAVYTRDESEGSYTNEEFRVTSKDGLIASFDVSLNYLTPPENVVKIFKKYRKPVYELEKTVLRNYLRDAFNKTASQFTADMLYERRAEFEAISDSLIRAILEPEGFVIEQVVILNELRLPESVVENINQKVAATQIAIKKQQEVAQARADADKKIEEARGEAESLLIRARAEAEANRLRQQTLNQLIIQQKWIEKWDGKLPVYGEVPKLWKGVE
ncbi:MAG: SPFH domain-containing protein [Cytophagales bacterium]|nr:SPFH domain-containing protein [Cytophagales bacterium]MDW8383695.1 SPFH domain-containing protein [Flammeovirgaceae bacterium]